MSQTLWEPGPANPCLTAGAVDVWRADLASGGERERLLLSDDERERAARFVRSEDGMRWAHARGILRALLGRYADADPRALCFATGPHGKPRLAPKAQQGGAGGRLRPAPVAGEGVGAAAASRLCFNLSHSADCALVAIALDREIGVDVELRRRRVDRVAIARRILGDEEADRLAALDERTREREFLRAWVRWEAVLKCRGTGIGGADDAPTGPDPWVVELDVGQPAAAALAAEDGPCTVRSFQWATAGA